MLLRLYAVDGDCLRSQVAGRDPLSYVRCGKRSLKGSIDQQ